MDCIAIFDGLINIYVKDYDAVIGSKQFGKYVSYILFYVLKSCL